jgi:hypothetical protein
MVLGAGQRSCGQFIAAVGQAPVGAVAMVEKRDGSKLYGELIRFREWMESFVSGYNAAYEANTDDQIRINLSSLDLWLRNWCNAHPTKSFAQAGQALRDELAPHR